MPNINASTIADGPMWHRKKDRIKAHIWICMMAYLIERIVEEEVRRIRGMTGSRVFSPIRSGKWRLMNRGLSTGGGSSISTEPDDKQLAILEALRVPPKSMVIRKRAFF